MKKSSSPLFPTNRLRCYNFFFSKNISYAHFVQMYRVEYRTRQNSMRMSWWWYVKKWLNMYFKAWCGRNFLAYKQTHTGSSFSHSRNGNDDAMWGCGRSTALPSTDTWNDVQTEKHEISFYLLLLIYDVNQMYVCSGDGACFGGGWDFFNIARSPYRFIFDIKASDVILRREGIVWWGEEKIVFF
jgi:hypothetical protein